LAGFEKSMSAADETSPSSTGPACKMAGFETPLASRT
jgi:hypothetical protein